MLPEALAELRGLVGAAGFMREGEVQALAAELLELDVKYAAKVGTQSTALLLELVCMYIYMH